MTSSERVKAALEALGMPGNVIEFEASTHTADDAAASVGCARGQIVKTLLFVAGGRPTVVLAAGDRQVDTAMLAPLLGVPRKKLKMGTAAEVMAFTGYEVGGVAPVGLANPCDIVVDESLRRFETVWSAAGDGHSVFPAETVRLVEAVGGQWAAVTRDAP